MVASIYILFLCAVFSSGVWTKNHSRTKPADGKIVGGYNTTISEFPYQVYMLVRKGKDYYQCGGSIISKTAILTAAHCLAGVQRAYIRIGSTDANSGGTSYQSSFFILHPSYNATTSDKDVRVIRLFPMTLDGKTSKAVKLPEKGADVPAGSNITVSGWGTTTEGGAVSDTLMAVTIPVISNEECSKNVTGLTKNMFCAGIEKGGKDSCQGDSGGPAVGDDGVQEGIVSFGMGCAREGYPGVYTKVSEVRTWIKLAAGV